MKDDKRKDYISKDEMFMLMARIVSKRSKDPNTQVGAVIVSDNDRILSVGYNGFPNGCSDDDFPWIRSHADERKTKYPYIVHSERNAILNYRGDLATLRGATLYVTLFPCHECAKSIIQVGIRKVVYLSNKYKDTMDYDESISMLNAAGVECVQYETNPDKACKMIYDIDNHLQDYKKDSDASKERTIKMYDSIIDAIR